MTVLPERTAHRCHRTRSARLELHPPTVVRAIYGIRAGDVIDNSAASRWATPTPFPDVHEERSGWPSGDSNTVSPAEPSELKRVALAADPNPRHRP